MSEQTDPRQQRELLKRLLQEKAQEPAQAVASCAQRRLWLVNRLEESNPSYNVPFHLRLRGTLDVPLLERCLAEVVRRHAVLRTTFREVDGEPVQVIAPTATVPVAVLDLAHTTGAEQQSRVALLIREESEALFDIARGPLIRAKLLRIAPQEHVLVLVMHHIVSDGWSVGVLVRELFTIYEALRAGRGSPLPRLPVQYYGHAAREARWLQGAEFQKQLAYWTGRLADLPVLELPTDRRRPPVKGFRGATHSFFVDAALAHELKQLGAREGATLNMILSAAYAVLLHRYARQDDIVFGTPIANRNRAELEALIGFFANMLVMRFDISGDPSFRELLARVSELTLGAYANQDIPFEQLVEKLRPERDPSRNPLFQVAIALHNEAAVPPAVTGLEIGQPVIPSCDVSEFGIEVATTRFDLELHLWEGADGMRGTWAYDVALFDADTIDRMGRHLVQILRAIVENPAGRVSALNMLTDAERDVLLRRWGRNELAYPRAATVHALFEQMSAASPDAIALVHGDRELRYGELDARANQLARYLERTGLRPGDLVGVCMERGIDLIVTLLGILKAGCAYVPLDPDYPAPRLKFMLEDTGVAVLVTRAGLKPNLPEYAGRIVCLDEEREAVQREDPARRDPTGTGEDLAYVMYTSGSTGTPKGVSIPHRGIVRLVRDTDYVQLAPGDRVVQASSVSFDAATFEIWGPLLNGACIVGVTRELTLVPADYAAFLRAQEISVMFITTALFNQLAREAPAAFSGMRAVLFGGEAVDVDCVRRVINAPERPRRLLHVYGPTECTTFATWHEIASVGDADTTVPIGRPIANTELLVLDEKRRPAPVGVLGELYIGGDGLAHGYWRRPELTAEKFVAHPDSDDPRARLYRTGDLVRWREPGVIEFAGRIDHQVKLRGFRIELGEIEARLKECAGIRDAVVILREDAHGDKRLVGYVTPETGTTLAPALLKSGLQGSLPGYMIPAAIVVLPELPLNRNGKVDRKALPGPERERAAQADHAVPVGNVEKEIADIWKDELGLQEIGAEENFFDLGAHSLMLARVRDKIEKRLNRPVPIVTLFQYPTLRSLAGHLSDAAPAHAGAAHDARSAAKVNSYAGESVAVVGLAGRFPGARNVDEFWNNLRNGVESVRFFTEEELRAAGVDEERIRNPGYVRAKGYLEDPDQFDATFFGYSPREAAFIDPQQRVCLEVAWEALENAGYDAARCRHAIGVYAGSSENTYWFSLINHPELRAAGMLENALASGKDFVATRVSYKMNLRGPAVTLQTACSTSLVAVHHACMSLLNGECGMALAGGVSVTVPTMAGHMYEENSIGSPDGHCRAFDEAGQGTLRGDGAGFVVLKRLSDALADGDTIHAVIRGSAINNDGSNKVGYTAPSVEGQAQAISAALAAAGVEPATIGYIEAHGTGTTLGDPIEIAALNQAFGSVTGRSRIGIGSVKTNVGHLDAAAGVTGLIKAVLALEHRELPPSLHFTKPNPKLGIENTPFYVNVRLRPWDAPPGAPRRAGVSSFGIGGTNAHVVLEEAPPQPMDGSPVRAHQLLVVSARTRAALDQATGKLANALACADAPELGDVAWTLQAGRKRFRHARILVCRAQNAVAALKAPATSGAVTVDQEPTHRAAVFLFSGQGSQHVDMARDLYHAEPRTLFREVVDACCETLRAPLGLDLRELMYPRAVSDAEAAVERLTQTRYAQPALFVIEYALARQWMAWGVQPAAMIGHSIGEYAAACLAGVMTLDDALALVAARGRLMYGLPAGSMLSVPLSPAELEPLLGAALSIATLNGPGMSVVSGTHAAVDALRARLERDGIEAKRLRTSHAFHSPMMEPILAEFTDQVRCLALRAPQIPYVSNLTGDWITAEQATDPAYYAWHLRQAVRFAEGLERLFAHPDRLLLEVGPGQALCTLARRHPDKPAEQAVVASLPRANERKGSDEAFLLQSLGQLWLHGIEPDWAALHAPRRARRVPLPTYPFERQRFWIEPARGTVADTSARAKRANPTEWFYAPSWKRASLPPPSGAPDAKRWMLFVDETGLGDALERSLRQHGATVVRVSAGAQYARRAPDDYVIDPRRAEDYRRLLADVGDAQAMPPRIVHLWGVPPENARNADDALLQRCLDRGCYSVMFLAQAVADRNLEDRVNLLVVTSQVHDVTGGERLCPEKVTVLGPCRVTGTEIPSLRARNLDIDLPGEDHGYPEHLLRAIVDEANADDAQSVAAYRGHYRWVQTVEPLPLAAPRDDAVPLRQGGVYLITGGLGGMGLELAAWLARIVRAKLVLVARSALPARAEWTRYVATAPAGEAARAKIERLLAIEAAGAEVMVLSADVANREQMRAAVAAARARFGAIHGVIHTAAVPGGGVLQRQTPQTFAAALAPKVQGTRILESLLRDTPPDFMALCSSLASLMNLPGRADYVSANAFIDAFARTRAGEGGPPVIAINWDTWVDVGMSVAQLASTGLRHVADDGLRNDEGVEAFRRILAARSPQVIVSVREPDLHRFAHAATATAATTEAPAATVGAAKKLHPRPALGNDYVAPRNDVEATLAAIWRDLLGIAEIGVHDNFFELGGDSVIGIQFTARAKQKGIRLTPKQIFEHETIAELAAVCGALPSATEATEPSSGRFPPTPIQRWFFEQEMPGNDLNMAVLLEMSGVLQESVLRDAVAALVAHHEALRMRVPAPGPHAEEIAILPEDRVPVERVDLSGLDPDTQKRRIQTAAEAAQRGMDLARGPIVRVVHFDLGAPRAGRLLIVIHHLAVDAVAWRILLEDLQAACAQRAAGEPVTLPPNTTSLHRWSTRLHEYAQTGAAEAELEHWLALGRTDSAPLPVDLRADDNTIGSTDSVARELEEGETGALLKDIPQAYKTQINDLLLTALARAFEGWTGRRELHLHLEGHGRDAFADDLDVSRTVGWFTTVYPVRLALPAGSDPADALISVKEQLRAIPHHGMNYGVLRYLNRKQALRDSLRALPEPELVFLYLGRFDQGVTGSAGLFAPASEATGFERNPQARRPYLFEITALVAGDRLRASVRYSTALHRRETAERIADGFMAALRGLIAHCSTAQAPRFTASDFPGARLDQSMLDRLAASLNPSN